MKKINIIHMNQQKQFQEGKLERRDRDVEAQSLFYLTVQWDFQQLCRAVFFNLSNSKMDFSSQNFGNCSPLISKLLKLRNTAGEISEDFLSHYFSEENCSEINFQMPFFYIN